MMHQMNRSATARKLEDPDGFRRTPVSAPLPRRGTDAGRRREQSVGAQQGLQGHRPGEQLGTCRGPVCRLNECCHRVPITVFVVVPQAYDEQSTGSDQVTLVTPGWE
jgi:hypothetical protein